MNKFRRLLGRISAETCLKMDYFCSKYQKSPSAEGVCKTLIPLYISGWCRCLAILGKTKLVFSVPSCPENVPTPLLPGIDRALLEDENPIFSSN